MGMSYDHSMWDVYRDTVLAETYRLPRILVGSKLRGLADIHFH